MKNQRVLMLAIIAAVSFQLFGQEADTFVNDNNKESNMPDSMNFMPREILVKFRDDIAINNEILEKKSSASKGLNSILSKIGIDKAERIFSEAKQVKTKKIIQTPLGTEMEITSLHNIYRLVFTGGSTGKGLPSDIYEAIKELRQLSEVVYAEPNFIYSIGNFRPASPEMNFQQANDRTSGIKLERGKGLTPDDPLYSQQWGIPAIKADEVWSTHTGDTSSVIAIIDSGVDWLHPDLVENIWINYNEIPGNGKDDDGNGYVDDIRGWDFINNDNDPKDDNSHGTHCAGIAAATGNNGLGIAGVNWTAKIMVVKVFQSSGWADAATISKGIEYAALNGADVLSMSFGSYALSLTMKQALANAYATSVLVAAAGNDGKYIGPLYNSTGSLLPTALFPAALSFVLGVEAPPRPPTGFTNYDQDGPIFSGYSEQYNYELSAPGISILSCIPGGSYRSYSGTSMATPFVAGAVSLYKEIRPNDSQELMWGSFINSLAGNIDIFGAINLIAQPHLNVTKFTISDTLAGGDSDLKADAGEIIQLEIFVRNTWGNTDSVYVGVDFDGFEDTSTATIIQREKIIGAAGSYGTISNFADPLEIKIGTNVSHGREIKFRLFTWKGKRKEFLTSVPIVIRIENGAELFGVLDDTLRLTHDKFWLVSNSFKIGPNGVLIIGPGTNIKIGKRITNYGKIIATGTKDSLITINGPEGIDGGFMRYKHTNFGGFNSVIIVGGDIIYENCHFYDYYYAIWNPLFSGGKQFFMNCEFNNMTGYVMFWWYTTFKIESSNFYSNNVGLYTGNGPPSEPIKYCNFANYVPPFYQNHISDCNFLTTSKSFYTTPEGFLWDLPLNYWGTTDSLKISSKIVDFWDNSALSMVNYSSILTRPAQQAHGCVWKVVVNGFDAQDEFKLLDPLGVGKHKFEVYFNRPMDIKYAPTVSTGVREPFNQIIVNENGSWSSDSTIYTVYKTLGLTGADGINRIQVVGGKDPAGFDLVPENERFNINIQSQGSLSTHFMASPGLGKVILEWSSPDEYVGDLLGYNMYRYEFVNDSTTTDTLLISRSMIIDTLYSDYDVVPGTRYFYCYKTIRTDFSESSFSKIVAAIPFTASKGDANGDLVVNVSDIISVVSFILEKNPQPFIFGAADVNNDSAINVLDVTGIVNRILNPGKSGGNISDKGSAKVFFRSDTVFIDTDVPVAGIQFTLHNVSSGGFTVLPAVEEFERATMQKADSVLFLAYSMSGKTIGPGIIPIIKLDSKSIWLDGLVLSNPDGSSINSIITEVAGPNDNTERMNSLFELSQNYPNPIHEETTISYSLSHPVDEINFTILNAMGQKVDEILIKYPVEGSNQFTWRPKTGGGLYLGKMSVRLSGKQSDSKTIKMIIQK